MEFSIYRFNPDTDSAPYMQSFTLPDDQVEPGMMLLDALLLLKEQDDSLGFRRSCQHGVCGSDGMNVNGTNGLACIMPLANLKAPVVLRPFPGMPVIRDLIVDMDNFYRQYREAEPWLINDSPEPEVERLQSPEDRDRLDGLYECILCGCCSASCPSYWWNPDRFLGPAALLQAARFIEDSRDQATEHRLERLDDAYRLYRCHGIMNCTQVCPKGLNPSKAIGDIRRTMIKRSV
ncbi:succinate dehydrogenase iron-sulfur subunit [Thioalkalivibrio sp.]|uniref:succinate dehydrogenase iron-sulfur subunit n=1 Tax=Thioalkalivibrio sp. TaxID=2093813 RepID=UPI0012D52291|nr:succinate dehydrogenase iron-sulfur subunit [Thioalkalivibrio sp.]TVP79427.1 MAG: succinate dehydrogenase iron-sulfur subunit [Thioalkalivibrio sp.]